jgi:hypothetical protein
MLDVDLDPSGLQETETSDEKPTFFVKVDSVVKESIETFLCSG